MTKKNESFYVYVPRTHYVPGKTKWLKEKKRASVGKGNNK